MPRKLSQIAQKRIDTEYLILQCLEDALKRKDHDDVKFYSRIYDFFMYDQTIIKKGLN